jgi:ubiquinone/menaquinone biosynthesis C-methylase UbiE
LKNGFEVSALDYSEIGVAQMRECAEITGVKVVLMALDARQGLPFSDASFDAVYSHMFFTMEFTESEVATLMAECYRVLRPGGLNVYSVRNFNDQHYGKFMPAGEDMWRNPLGFVVHFYSMQAIRRLSRGYEILHINEFEDGSPPSVKKLYEVVLERHSGER